MTPRQMLIFTLREREGWSIAKIAERLRVQETVVRAALRNVDIQTRDGGKERVSA